MYRKITLSLFVVFLAVGGGQALADKPPRLPSSAGPGMLQLGEPDPDGKVRSFKVVEPVKDGQRVWTYGSDSRNRLQQVQEVPDDDKGETKTTWPK